MPKYYRFRPTSPTRKAKRYKDTEEVVEEIERNISENEIQWMDLTLACMPLSNWYLRRTSWRLSSSLMGIPRPQPTNITTPLQIGNRRFYVLKVPAHHTHSPSWSAFVFK